MALSSVIHKKTIGSVGSVGSIGYDEVNNRCKGILLSRIMDRKGLEAAFAHAKKAEDENKSSTRTTFRAFVDRSLVESIRKGEQDAIRSILNDRHLQVDGIQYDLCNSVRNGGGVSYHIEAVVPTGISSGCDLVYFGKNSHVRAPPPNIVEQEMALLAKAQASKTVNLDDAMARVKGSSYSIGLFDGKNPEDGDIARLLELYNEAYQLYTFKITDEAIRGLVNNGNRTYVARDNDGRIASCLIAEGCTIELDSGSKIGMYELSDFATFRADRGAGLITALQLYAEKDLRGDDPHAIVYAEDRAPWMAVNKSSKQAGLEYCGTLPFHCTIISDRNVNYNLNHEFESLNVWAAKPSAAGEVFGSP